MKWEDYRTQRQCRGSPRRGDGIGPAGCRFPIGGAGRLGIGGLIMVGLISWRSASTRAPHRRPGNDPGWWPAAPIRSRSAAAAPMRPNGAGARTGQAPAAPRDRRISKASSSPPPWPRPRTSGARSSPLAAETIRTRAGAVLGPDPVRLRLRRNRPWGRSIARRTSGFISISPSSAICATGSTRRAISPPPM